MTRTTMVLLGVLGVLVVIAVLVMQKPGERSSTGETGELLVAVDSLAVDHIVLHSPSENIVLQKRGAEWFLERPVSYPADQANVASLIHEAKHLEVKNIVSSKPDRQSVFQVDSTGMTVTVSVQGSEKASFVLGKSGSSYTEMYARRANSNDVALVNGASSYVFHRPVKEWRDRTIAKVPRESIKEVRFQYGDTTFVLAERDSTWLIGKDSTQEGVVNNFLSSLSNVQADDFNDSLLKAPSRPSAQISYTGTQLTFFYVKAGDKYLVQCSRSPQWFEMQSWRAGQVLKRRKDFLR